MDTEAAVADGGGCTLSIRRRRRLAVGSGLFAGNQGAGAEHAGLWRAVAHRLECETGGGGGVVMSPPYVGVRRGRAGGALQEVGRPAAASRGVAERGHQEQRRLTCLRARCRRRGRQRSGSRLVVVRCSLSSSRGSTATRQAPDLEDKDVSTRQAGTLAYAFGRTN